MLPVREAFPETPSLLQILSNPLLCLIFPHLEWSIVFFTYNMVYFTFSDIKWCLSCIYFIIYTYIIVAIIISPHTWSKVSVELVLSVY